ncbi:MAG: LacI family transcriptional regulator [Opitutaceae bacterium]|nr:LacI family transcriptional regulator [Opitutaceae bacterium]
MPPPRPPVTLRDIAERVGLSRMSVSCALRHSPRVKKETAERIWAVARELGYSPDPRMAAAMTRVRDTKFKTLEPVAWLNGNLNAHAYSEYTWLAPYREGAAERCMELGYKLDDFWLREPGMTDRRMSSILENRGIRGVIVCPSVLPYVPRLRLEWRHFSSVSLETAVLAPHLHRVEADYYHNIQVALKVLRRIGYRRIGLFLQNQEQQRSRHKYIAGLLYFQSGIPARERVPYCGYKLFDPGILKAWLDRTKPDVVLAHHSKVLASVRDFGFRVPREIGVAHLSLDGDCEDWAGIWKHKRLIGAQAAEQLVSMIQNQRKGLPEVACETLVPGEWRHGKTLLPHVKK